VSERSTFAIIAQDGTRTKVYGDWGQTVRDAKALATKTGARVQIVARGSWTQLAVVDPDGLVL
jgi:hypothetical protein